MSSPAATTPRVPTAAPTWLIWVALSIVYVIWSTTYLGIRITNETLPPLIAAGTRFVIAGGVLLAITIRRGDVRGDPVGRTQWWAAFVVGASLIAGGNGSVVLAERTIPSGTVALILALVPLWIALYDRVVGHRSLPLRVVLGLVIGFAGAALLVGDARVGGLPLSGLLVAVGASVSWAAGSLAARNAALPHRPFVGNAMVMMAGGAISLLWGIARGELPLVDPDRFSTASVLALLYLIVFGSWIAFTAYLWLLRNARTSLVATYAWVTPMLAVYLGYLIADEQIRGRSLVAGAVVLAAVALTVSAGGVARDDAGSDTGQERRAKDEAEVPL
ncbi:MAG TPA: EamA family transporter [Actinomycetota bacterium]|nr:EamA family transporter [Actinomycetota bacterium]